MRVALGDALPVAGLSAIAFAAIVLIPGRPRGAMVAQIALTLAAALVFVAIVVEDGVAGIAAIALGTIGVGLMAAAVSGMLYHLYLGRFEAVWTARAVFTLVYFVTAGLFGFVFLSFF